jgi:hypothetical protein
MQPCVRKALNELSTNVFHIAQQANPYIMGLVGMMCQKQILTTGNVPKPKKKEAGDVVKGSHNPSFGFVNQSHIDTLDVLRPDQVAKWKLIATEKNWGSCCKILDQRNFCLPTTCGYQFTFKDSARDSLAVKAYFGMPGLGLAMQIEDGVAHHFMGAMLSHQTCLCVCQRKSDGHLSASNSDGQFLLVGWGTSGGSRDVDVAAAATDTAGD